MSSADFETSARRAAGSSAARPIAVFVTTLAVVSLAGWRWLPEFEQPAVGPFEVRTSVQLRGDGAGEASASRLSHLASVEAVTQAGLETGQDLEGQAAAIAEALQVESRPASSGLELVVRLPRVSELDARSAAALVNRLVENYIAAADAGRIHAAEAAHAVAQERLGRARTSLVEARAELDALVDRLAVVEQTLPVQEPVEEESSTAQLRSELNRQLADMLLRRGELLERRTPAHPEVLDIEQKIAATQARIAELGRPAARPVAASPSAKLAEDLKPLRARASEAQKQYDQAFEAERRTAERLAAYRGRETLVWTPAAAAAVASKAGDGSFSQMAFILAGLALACCTTALVGRPAALVATASNVERAAGVPLAGTVRAA